MSNELYDQCVAEAEACHADNKRTREALWALQSEWMKCHVMDVFPKQMGSANQGISITVGWMPVIENMCKEIQVVLDANPGFNVSFVQIKEKFGGLRAYARYYSTDENGQPTAFNEFGTPGVADNTSTLPEQITAIIYKAEDAADNACMVCGQQASERKSVQRSFYKACDKHAIL